MGWFGKMLLDGDVPAEMISEIICDIAGIDDEEIDFREPNKMLREALQKKQHEIIVRARRGKNERNIWFQVAGVIMMAQGIDMSDAIAKEFSAALDNDEWSKRDIERATYVKSARNTLANYDGKTPVYYVDDFIRTNGIELNDIQMSATSDKMLGLAMRSIADAIKDKPWFRGVRYAFNPAGYRILLVIDEKHAESVIKEANSATCDIPFEMFQIPVSFYADDQKTVMKYEDEV